MSIMEEINLDLIFFKHTGAHVNSRIYSAMLEACHKVIFECAKNASVDLVCSDHLEDVEVDRKSILDTKNQIV